MDAQDRVARFAVEHDIEGRAAYQLLDLVEEVGEIAGEVTGSTAYGLEPDDIDVARDELGDALFSFLMVCESLDVDADAALDEALAKYERRIEETGSPSSDG